MSWFSATVHAYDVMDSVHIIVSLRSTTEDRAECIEPVLHLATTIQGTGEVDEREWLRDALVAALEVI